MRLKRKNKLSLLDNYVTIYRILYNCKALLCKATETQYIKELESLCDQSLDLKLKYERAFKKLKMYNTSFLCLKEELDNCKNIYSFTPFSIFELKSTISLVEEDYFKYKLNKI